MLPRAGRPGKHLPAVGAWAAYMRRRGYSVETRRHRTGTVRWWLAWIGERWPGATFRDVEAFAAGLDVSTATQRAYLSHLRAFYRWALREGLLTHDATALVDLPRAPMRLPRPAPDPAIADVLVDAPVELAAMVALMAGAGLRCCEVAALDWDDVDLAGARAVVHGKGGRDRTVYLSGDVVRFVAGLDGTTGPIFTSPHRAGRPRYSAHRVSQIVSEAFRAAGHPISAHQLRHRAATVALAGADGDLLAVRDMLGHASVATTQLYTRVVEGRAAAVARAVGLPT